MNIDRNTLSGAKITVLGAARSGIDAALLLKEAGAKVFLSEKASQDEKRNELQRLESEQIDFEFGGHTEHIFDADAFVVSPGIPVSHPLLQEAKSRQIDVLGELEVASWFCKGKIVAITGSNGKTTATSMLGEMVKKSGQSCIVAGNIGTTFSSQVNRIGEDGIAVLEVSNFQLETIREFHPDVAVLLNLTPDHIDRHGTFAEYIRMKARLFENQNTTDMAIFNGDDSEVAWLVPTIKSQPLAFQFQDPNTDGAYVDRGWLTIRWKNRSVPVLHQDDMGIPGPHNVANGLAAAMAATCLGVSAESIGDALKSFQGLPHRLELVREINHVQWYNDSKATNTDSLQCALSSFRNPIILIAGGRDKDSDFSVLKSMIQSKVRRVILIGEAADKMEAAWQGATELVHSDSLHDAVNHANKIARSDDVVLLSPGCASFDMFLNFEDRGDQFKRMVMSI